MENKVSNNESKVSTYEASANKFSIKCQFMTMIFPFITWILNCMGVFIVDRRLMAVSLLSSLLVTVATVVICEMLGMYNRMTKYFAMAGIVIAIFVQSSALTYHMYILVVLPIIYSLMYGNRKLVYYTFGLSMIGIMLSVYIGYYYGLCDANMVVLTRGTISEYIDVTGTFFKQTPVNPNPMLTLFLYFVVPRWMLLLAVMIMVMHISDMICNKAANEEHLKQLSEIDAMTGVYNKNKYLNMVRYYYPDVNNVAVIFWDVNRLKETNDTFGHVYGDFLIKSIADSIREAVGVEGNIFRVGGDEFVAIIENTRKENVRDIIARCESNIKKRDDSSKVAVSASVGYAYGLGRDIEEIIQKADTNMYKQKHILKQAREDIKENNNQ